MCGIFGWSYARKAKLPASQRETVATVLAVANSFRGDQSWGLYSLTHGSAPKVRREVGDIAKVAGLGGYGLAHVVMGHTRYATVGAITRENQHPFKVGHVLLAHNGVVFNHESLNVKHGRACVVDSQHLAHHIDEGLPLGEIEGYGAIEWIEDKHPAVIYLSRLRSGSLTVAGIRKEGSDKTVGVAWSSDRAHLKAALEAARLNYYLFEDLKEGEVYEVRAGMLYTTKRPCMAISAPVLTDSEVGRFQRATSGGLISRFRDRPKHAADWLRWSKGEDSLPARWAELEPTGTPEPKGDDDEEASPFLSDAEEAAVARYVEEHGLVTIDADMWASPNGDCMDVDDILDAISDEEVEREQEAEALRQFQVITGSETKGSAL